MINILYIPWNISHTQCLPALWIKQSDYILRQFLLSFIGVYTVLRKTLLLLLLSKFNAGLQNWKFEKSAIEIKSNLCHCWPKNSHKFSICIKCTHFYTALWAWQTLVIVCFHSRAVFFFQKEKLIRVYNNIPVIKQWPKCHELKTLKQGQLYIMNPIKTLVAKNWLTWALVQLYLDHTILQQTCPLQHPSGLHIWNTEQTKFKNQITLRVCVSEWVVFKPTR